MDHKIEALDLNKISYLILNEIEGKDLTGESEPGPMLRSLIARYPDIKLILTLGSKGAIYRYRLQEVRQQATPSPATSLHRSARIRPFPKRCYWPAKRPLSQ